MAAPIASVLNEANVIASKQFKSNSTGSTSTPGDSFNQVLAKQIHAKSNEKVNKEKSQSIDHAATSKVQEKSTVSTDQADETNSADKLNIKDDKKDDLGNPPLFFTLVENIVQSNALKPEKSEDEKNVQAAVNAPIDSATAATLKDDDLTGLDTAKKTDDPDEPVENKTQTGFKENLASALSPAQSQKENQNSPDSIVKTKPTSPDTITNQLVSDNKKITVKDNDNSTDKVNTKKNAELLTQSNASDHADGIKEAQASKVENTLSQTKLAVEKQALPTTSKDTAQSSAPADSVPSTALNLAQSSAQVINVLPQAVEHLTPHVGTRAWDQALGQKVIWLVAGGQQTAELTLNPPDLGPLQVVLNVNNDQLSVNFSAHQQDVRDALESSLPKLKQILNDAGLQLSGFSVNAGTQNSNQQFQQEHSASNFRSSQLIQKSDAISIATPSSPTRVAVKEGLVDTFV
jgi:flagellar hook-length control protein FliK